MNDLTPAYFKEEVLRFHELMGKKSFWEKPEMASRAYYGLLYVYVHTEDLKEDDEILMQAMSEEFDRRLFHVLMIKGG